MPLKAVSYHMHACTIEFLSLISSLLTLPMKATGSAGVIS